MDLYVDVHGDDRTGDGSKDNPFSTLRKASEIATPGSTVYIRSGTYSRDVISTSSGTADAPIIYTGYNNDIPRFVSENPGEAALVIYSQHCIIDGVKIHSSVHCGIVVWNTSHVQIRNCVIEQCHRCGIYVGGTVGKTNFTGIQIRSNSISGTCLSRQKRFEEKATPAAVVVSKTTGAIIEDNTIDSNYGEGLIFCTSVGGTICHNIIYDNYRAGIYLENCGHSVIERNYVYSTGKSRFFMDNSTDQSSYKIPMIGILIGNENPDIFINTENLIIQNNILAKYSYGILYDSREKSSGIHRCQILNNTFHRGYRAAIKIMDSHHQSTKNVVINNIFDHRKAYKPMIDLGNPYGFTFSYNGWSHSSPYSRGQHDVVGDTKMLVQTHFHNVRDPGSEYKLKESSPMRDAGKYIPAVTVDFWGNARTAPYCIGAHELNVESHHYSAATDSATYRYPIHM